MAKYNIKLFAHGVPKGQDIWGNPGADAKYIEAFYGRQANIASQMFVEVMKFGGETNTYYTYFRYGNFQEIGGRTGGYFALTIRINYYYSDIQNIYNLLEAGYNKYIVGSIIDQTKGGSRFLVTQLGQANDNLKALEAEMEHYLMQFSSDADFISLNGFRCNGQEDFAIINLLEASTSTVYNHVKSKGKISVSPLHPTSKEQQIINQKNAEVQAINANAQQQITATQQKAKNDVATAQQQAALGIQAAQKDKEDSIKAIRNEYKDADRTISQLRSQINDANKKIDTLSSQLKKMSDDLENAKTYKEKYDKAQQELEKSNKVLSDVKGNLSGLSGIAEILGVSTGSNNYYSGSHHHNNSGNTKKEGIGFVSIVKSLHPFTDFFVMVLLLGIVAITIPKSCSSDGDSESLKEQLMAANEKIESLEQQIQDNNLTNSDGYTRQAQEDNNLHNSLKDKFASAKIDISDISTSKPISIHGTSPHKVSLLNAPEDINGNWESQDFAITDQGIFPYHSGNCTINYVVNGQVVVSRTINVAP